MVEYSVECSSLYLSEAGYGADPLAIAPGPGDGGEGHPPRLADYLRACKVGLNLLV